MALSESCLQVDHLILGSGVAGLNLARKLSESGQSIVLLSKNNSNESNSWYAQGGIASVLSESDTYDKHIADTLTAGAGLCHPEVVKLVVENGPKAISELIEIGVQFTQDFAQDKNKTQYHLTREGGHSERRVIHSKDATGREVVESLRRTVGQLKNVAILENQIAIDLVTTDKIKPRFDGNFCLGVYVFNLTTNAVTTIAAKNTYLCTGGLGKAYLFTSNPDDATGDGVAMAYRAGCKIANLEFMQFHPTCLFHHATKNFLVSEAVRGEGAVLCDKNYVEIDFNQHPLKSLAPRDIVARAIDLHMKTTGESCVFLNIKPIGLQKFAELFPTIYAKILETGISLESGLIPVVPAAHYSCGGIVVDDYSRTNIGGLYAIGESACTGLHGANRLASNSLLEALVFSARVCEISVKNSPNGNEITIPTWVQRPQKIAEDERVVLTHTWDEIRRIMWNYVGIVRTERRLTRALNRLRALRTELDEYYWNCVLSKDILEVRNLALVSELIVQCALKRKSSVGSHFMLDSPWNDFKPIDTILN